LRCRCSPMRPRLQFPHRPEPKRVASLHRPRRACGAS
jgi:hypothetical protein